MAAQVHPRRRLMRYHGSFRRWGMLGAATVRPGKTDACAPHRAPARPDLGLICRLVVRGATAGRTDLESASEVDRPEEPPRRWGHPGVSVLSAAKDEAAQRLTHFPPGWSLPILRSVGASRRRAMRLGVIEIGTCSSARRRMPMVT